MAAAGALALGSLVSVVPAGAQEAEPPPPPLLLPPVDPAAPVREPGVPPPLSPRLADVPVTSPDYDRVAAERDGIAEELALTIRVKDDSATLLFELAERDAELGEQIAEARRRIRDASGRVGLHRETLRELAIASYVSGRAGEQDDISLDLDDTTAERTHEVLAGSVNSDVRARLKTARQDLARARTDEELAVAVRAGVRATIDDTVDRRLKAVADEQRLTRELFVAELAVVEASRLASVDGVDFPLVVLDAYVRAADRMAAEKPECGITWWALAGIGLTESRHGTYRGGEVRGDGSLSQPILGIPLDGSNGTAVIAGPGGPDRAQGPMQFITSTWARWYRDGNGDLVADVQNLYDAAAGAAAYLCAGGPMDTDEGLRRGYFSYNRSLAYVEIVLGRAHAYEAALSVPEAPAG